MGIEADGFVGPGTVKAIENFQMGNGLTVNGTLDETTWNYGLHFMIFNKECLKLFSDLITKELYMRFNSGNAFDCLEKIAQIMNCDRGDKFAEDEIYYFENNDLFNFSPFKD
jgi:peptidoglycan hydrolase-like protein with peptidoglycan-binding domain